jgi:hypothetical protein
MSGHGVNAKELGVPKSGAGSSTVELMVPLAGAGVSILTPSNSVLPSLGLWSEMCRLCRGGLCGRCWLGCRRELELGGVFSDRKGELSSPICVKDEEISLADMALPFRIGVSQPAVSVHTIGKTFLVIPSVTDCVVDLGRECRAVGLPRKHACCCRREPSTGQGGSGAQGTAGGDAPHCGINIDCCWKSNLLFLGPQG